MFKPNTPLESTKGVENIFYHTVRVPHKEECRRKCSGCCWCGGWRKASSAGYSYNSCTELSEAKITAVIEEKLVPMKCGQLTLYRLHIYLCLIPGCIKCKIPYPIRAIIRPYTLHGSALKHVILLKETANGRLISAFRAVQKCSQ